MASLLARLRTALRRLILGDMPEDIRMALAAQERTARELALLRAEVERLDRRLRDEEMQIRTALLERRSFVPEALASREVRSLAPTNEIPLEQAFEKLRALAPGAYAKWREAFDAGHRQYDGLPTDSCSVAGHRMARRFRAFLRPFLRGAVLDLGCGPQPVPLYLEDYPVERIAGIDPLAPATPHPFAFARGFAEFLPWDDGTFDVVVAATSMDHVLELERALREIDRVLRPGGHLVMWDAFVEGSPRYDPRRPDLQPIDAYHLFHFDVPWFEELVRGAFVIEESFLFPEPHADGFYALRTRKRSERERSP